MTNGRQNNGTNVRRMFGYFVIGAAFMMGSAVAASPASGADRDLTDLSIEDLMNLEITSTSRRPTHYFDSANAIFVINQEMIRRSTATSIPELLRIVPGLDVARLDGNKWAISSRGGNGLFASSLLVLVDGRTVYTPTFSGVFWDNLDMPLSLLERIEVVRGPGASLWGVNAVNGVINIITKNSAESAGWTAALGVGSLDRSLNQVAYGGKLESGTYRVHAQYRDRDDLERPNGEEANDRWDAYRLGMRADLAPSEQDSVMVSTELTSERFGTRASVPNFASFQSQDSDYDDRGVGWHALGRWAHTWSNGAVTEIQAYFDRMDRQLASIRAAVSTTDIDVQHSQKVGEMVRLTGGINARVNRFNVDDAPRALFQVDDRERSNEIVTGFLHSEITLIPDTLLVTFGARVEHNNYTEWVTQPNARASYSLNERNVLWASWSQAARTPSFAERELRLRNRILGQEPLSGLPIAATIVGDGTVGNTTLRAIEAGYRSLLAEDLLFELAVFRNDYDGLVSSTPGAPGFSDFVAPHITQSIILNNGEDLLATGFELSLTAQISEALRFTSAVSYLETDYRPNDVSLGVSGNPSPYTRVYNSLAVDLSDTASWTLNHWYVSGVHQQFVDSYDRFDTKVQWRATESLTLSLIAENLFDDAHREYGDVNELNVLASDIPRTFMALAEWRWK